MKCIDSLLHIYRDMKGFQPSTLHIVKGFLEIHKASINPLIIGSALLDKGLEGQYVIQSCESLPKACLSI